MAADFAEKNNLLLIADISQSAGCIPVDVDGWNADAVVFTGHKSLLGIQGTGGFYIREGISLKPLKYGGTGRNSQQLTYENGDYEYEVGTQNIPGIIGLLAGTEYILQTGLDWIQKKEEMLMELLYEGLKKIDGIQIYGSPKGRRGPVLSMNFDGLKASDAAYILESGYGITVRAGLHCSPLIHQAMGTENGGTVRVSISWFTGEKDIQAFLTAAGTDCSFLKKVAESDEIVWKNYLKGTKVKMKILGKQPSREKCAESGWFATDYLLDQPIDREFILSLKPLGSFVYLDMLKEPFFKIESDYYMIKGVQGKDYFRIAVHGKHEEELEKLERFLG